MLHNGEEVGDGSPPQVDIAVDPLEGTRLCALGMPSALAVIALSERGTMFDPGPCVYMEKMAGGEQIADLLDLDRPLGETVEPDRRAQGHRVGDVTAVVLDRPRHEEGINAIRAAGARVRLITDGDVVRRAARGLPSARPSTCCGASAARRRASSPRARPSAWAARWWAGCGRATTTSARPAIDAGYDLDRVAHPRRSRQGRQRVLLGHRRHRRRRARRASATRARAARRRSRWSCARGRARSGASTPATTARSCAR